MEVGGKWKRKWEESGNGSGRKVKMEVGGKWKGKLSEKWEGSGNQSW